MQRDSRNIVSRRKALVRLWRLASDRAPLGLQPTVIAGLRRGSVHCSMLDAVRSLAVEGGAVKRDAATDKYASHAVLTLFIDYAEVSGFDPLARDVAYAWDARLPQRVRTMWQRCAYWYNLNLTASFVPDYMIRDTSHSSERYVPLPMFVRQACLHPAMVCCAQGPLVYRLAGYAIFGTPDSCRPNSVSHGCIEPSAWSLRSTLSDQ